MAGTIIISEETARTIIEAHVSMAAWYHQMADALRHSGGRPSPPETAQLSAYLTQFGTQFPELAALAERIEQPQLYTPPPAIATAGAVVANEEVANAIVANEEVANEEVANAGITNAGITNAGVAAPPPTVTAPDVQAGPPPPPMVDPGKVKYD
jgi:hypothetical protein